MSILDRPFAAAAVGVAAALYDGRLYLGDIQTNIVLSGTFSIGFTIGPEPAVGSLDISVTGTRSMLVEEFVGGTVSGGTPARNFPRNHWKPQGEPTTFFNEGVTIDVAGTLIGEINIGVQDRQEGLAQGLGLVFAPLTSYYLTLTNLEQTADVHIGFVNYTLPRM